MSVRRAPSPARLLVSAIYRDEGQVGGILEAMAGRIGAVERVSRAFPFDMTEYYEREMGAPLFRRFAVMEQLVPRDFLPEAKIAAEEMEREFSRNGKRTVNMDPGLLSEENFILATGKNYSHRVYLRDGVFADLTLVFRKGEYQALPWTYPDLASGDIRAFLAEERAFLMELRKKDRGTSECGPA